MEHFGGILFMDIETVPAYPSFNLLPEGMQSEWERKARTIKGLADANAEPAAAFEERAGVYSEFAKIVCISFGSIYFADDKYFIRLKSLAGDDEKLILLEFAKVIERVEKMHKGIRFCGHNVKEFDVPFICRRFVINAIPLPQCLQLSGKKPWEISHIDTMEMWKFGDYKNYTSLSLLANVFGIPSPKSDIDGSQVGSVYWKDGDVARISKYCLGDVLTTAKVYLRLSGFADIDLIPDYADLPEAD